ncbi:Uncharacterised protein [Klebsiella pneumoniae]|nr:Uncharacterised protein [Klebsiella pneumoniae]
MAFIDKLFRQLCIVIVRPAFCRTKLRARAEPNHRAFGRNAKCVTGVGFLPIAYLELRPQQRLRQIFRAAHHAFVVGQRHVALDHQRPGLFIQHTGIVQQAVAHFTAPAGTMRDARKEGHKGRFEGVRQHVGAVIAFLAQAVAEFAAFTDFQRPVAERHRDRLVHFRHTR